MTCMSDYIQLTNISKTFGKQTVLQPHTMGFEEGMIHGIIGRNGSGKTVLMKMILGILQPTTGTVIVGDKRIGKDVDFPESAGAIIETIEFIPYMSAYQNLADIAAMRGNLSKTQGSARDGRLRKCRKKACIKVFHGNATAPGNRTGSNGVSEASDIRRADEWHG